MEQGIRRRRLGAQAWRGILERFGTSSLTIEEFCLGESVSAKSLYRWRTRLRGPVDSDMVPRAATGRDDTTVSFVDLGSLRAQGASASRLELKLDLGGGLMLHLVRG